MKNITLDASFEETVTVVSSSTAIAAGSGSLPVFGTPCMIALMEKATCGAVAEFLDDGETTVGTSINIAHSKASGIGNRITAHAEVLAVDGRKITFKVYATDKAGDVIGSGTIERFAVLSDKFMKRIEENEV